MSARAKAGVDIAEVEGEPLEPSCISEAKAVVVAAEVEGEPLEPSCVGEGEGRRSRRRSRRRAP